MFLFYGLFSLALVFGLPILLIVLSVAARRSRRDIRILQASVRAMHQTLKAREATHAPAPPAAAARADGPKPTEYREEAPPEPAPPAREEPAPEAHHPEPTPPIPPPKLPAAPPTAPGPPRASFEERLASRWLVWLGGAALALGGGFLVKYTVELGLLGPTARVVLGLMLAVAMVAAGERLRRHPLQRAITALKNAYVPAAITAGGICTAYASVYAAFDFYALIPPLVAFALMAAISAAAVGLAFLHGPFIAALGMIGAYGVPMLVTTGNTNAWALFPYLVIVTAGGLTVLRYVDWRWLGWLILAGSGAWPVLWFAGPWRPGDGAPLGAYLVAGAAMFLLVRRPIEEPDVPVETLSIGRMVPTDATAILSTAGAFLFSVLMFMLVRMDNYGIASLVSLGALSLLILLVARRQPAFEILPPFAAALAALVMATWRMPGTLAVDPMVEFSTVIVPAEIEPYVLTAIGLAGVFALTGFVALWGARRPGFWAAISAATPTVLLAIAFWRIRGFAVDLSWAFVSLGLGTLFIAATSRIAKYPGPQKLDAALGAYAVGVTAALALAATMTLEQAWLTAALAFMLPAIAWIHGRIGVQGLRWTSLVLAAVVLVRLVINYHVLDYRIIGPAPGVNWLLYGYGLPAIAFYMAQRMFRRQADDALVSVLEAGALCFFVLLVSLEIRHFAGDGRIDHGTYSLLEQSLQSIAWLTIAYWLIRRQRHAPRRVAYWGWRILAGMAAGQVVFLQCLVSNPLITGDTVGTGLVFNLLFVAYAVPALFALLLFWEARQQNLKIEAGIAGTLSLVLAFIWLSLEIRHGFHGTQLSGGRTTDAELYSYSAGWLVYAGSLLAVGIWRGYAALRYASLAIVLISVGKVFLYDMAALKGFFRAVSFLGLGASLVAIGFLYQRFVFPPRPRHHEGEDALAGDQGTNR